MKRRNLPWQLEHFMCNSAHSLDVLALEVRAHGAKAAADRIVAIARDLRSRAVRVYDFESTDT
jgi:hypothetical protein